MHNSECCICPRNCHIDRKISVGYCGAGKNLKISKAYLHKWEEPCISGKNGSGTVFFSNCQLKCCFCQNYKISHGGYGAEITTARLGEIFLKLQSDGAHNINLVTPTPYVHLITEALDAVKTKLKIPVIYNCGGYERAETIAALDGYIDIFMPDIKFYSAELSKKYIGAADYFEYAANALEKMLSLVGKPTFDCDGIMRRGVIVRHLIMPSCYRDSIEILHRLHDRFGTDGFKLSLMSQYTPYGNADKYPEINRRITTFEYNKVVDCAAELGFDGYCQDKSSSDEAYIPDFDLKGVF